MDKRRGIWDAVWILFAVGLLVWVFCVAFRALAWAQWIKLVCKWVPPGWLRAWLLGW